MDQAKTASTKVAKVGAYVVSAGVISQAVVVLFLQHLTPMQQDAASILITAVINMIAFGFELIVIDDIFSLRQGK
jgi:hypothetical protein